MKFRSAQKEDIPEIVKLIVGDKLGSQRDVFREPLPAQYYTAFENIQKDPNQELMVLVDENNSIIGTFQLSFLQYLTYQGGLRAQIEAVRIREDRRGQGIGEKMMHWAIARAKQKGAHVLQLTTDKKRPEAIRFYEKIGFASSHEGMKLHL
jgi:GNAT superfamily N-acetyltransferase